MKDEDIENMTYKGIKVSVIREALHQAVEDWLERHKNDVDKGLQKQDSESKK